MILEIKTIEQLKEMSSQEFEDYCCRMIIELAGGIKDMLDMVSDQTKIPKITVMAALAEVAVVTLPDDEPRRSESIKDFIAFFTDRAAEATGDSTEKH